ncbi:MAG TPA: zf-HC2 domain-containing protein [Candidatus Acidoferrales bacterium]|nr:zf-HC2 domain-containing protein [Candidatus Acidoferrales bacterium]
MTCREIGRHLPGYLDGAASSEKHAVVRAHLDSCADCRTDLERYRRLARALACSTAVAPPADLAMRIRVQASRIQGRQENRGQLRSRAWVFFENILQPLAVPATGGFLTAALVFVFVVQSLFGGIPLGNIPNDLPTDLIQPARLESLAPFPAPDIVSSGNYSSAGVLMVEATLNAEGQVAGYTILSGPNDPEVRHQIDQMLIFSRFRPEMNFGRPTAGGRVVLSFSEIRVRG